MVDGNDKRYLVDVSSQDMALFAQISGLADDVIFPILNFRDPFGTICQRLYFDKIAYRYRVCATNTADAEIAFDMTFRIRTIVHANDVTAARRFDD